MARLPQVGGDQGNWGEILNTFLLVEHNPDGSLKQSSAIAGKYSKPNNGIPESDLSSAVATKLNQVSPVQSVAGKVGTVVLAKDDVGLSNVDNTNDANKPISTATQAALDTKAGASQTATALNARINLTEKGAANGVATLGANSIVPAAQLGSGTATTSTFLRGDGTWQTSSTAVSSAQISDATTIGRTILTSADASAVRTAIGAGVSNLTLGTTSSTAKAGDYTPTKADVGLSNVDNTNDASKPVSTSQQAALDLKAPLASPAFTGTATAMTLNSNSVVTASLQITGSNPGAGKLLTSDASGNATWSVPGSAPVTSVAGRTGAITLAEGDIANLATDLAATEKSANKGASSGYAPLDSSSKLPTSNLPATIPIGNLPVGTNATSVAAGNDGRIVGALQSGNNLSDVTSVATALTNLGASTALNTQSVQSANFTASANQIVPVDATSAAITVTLPTTPADKSRIVVKKVDVSTNVVTIAAGGSDVFNKAGGSTNISLQLANQSETMQYASNGGIWYVISDDVPLNALDSRYNTAIALRDSVASTLSNKTIDATNNATFKSSNFTLQDSTDTTKQARFDVSAIATGTTVIPQLPNSSAQLANISSAQTLTNKSLDNTNTITAKTGSFTLQDSTDPTKQLQFNITAVATGTTVVPAFPNSNAQIVNLSSTQTLTNKTVTSAVVNTPVIQYTATTLNSITTLTTLNRSTIYSLDASGGAFTVTLPNTAAAGYQFFFKKIDSSANIVTITAATSPVFDNTSSAVILTDRGQYIEFTSTVTSGTFYTSRSSLGVPGGKNLIQNGSFEGTVTNAVANGASIATDSTNFRTGTRSIQITHATSASDNGIRLVNLVAGALATNTMYTIQEWVYIPSSSPVGSVHFSIQGTAVGSIYGTPIVSVANTWTRMQATFLTAATSGTLQIYSVGTNTTAGQLHNVDDVVLQEGTVATGYTSSPDDAVDVYSTQSIVGAKTFSTSITSSGPLYLANGANIVPGVTTGSMIGTAANQKMSFYGVTPVIQPVATTDLGVVLSSLGLRAAGTAYTVTTTGAASLGNTTAVNFKETGSLQLGYALNTTSLTTTVNTPPYQMCDATTGAITVTLVGTTTAGIELIIKKVDASANAVTISGGTIDGASSFVLSSQYKYIKVISTATSGVWYNVGSN